MCQVCGSPEAEPHFGGISCRACAAFFRRYYRSGRILNMCTCKRREYNSHPCGKCRIDKCLRVGMSPKKIQECRDKHCARVPKPSTNQSPPALPVTRPISKETSIISFSISYWQKFQLNHVGRMGGMNIFDMTSNTKMDLDIIRKMVNTMFPTTRELMEKDQTSLVRNFLPKFWMFSPVLDCIENPYFFENMNKENYEKMIVSFYDGAFVKGKEMSKNEILKIFEPFWNAFFTKTVIPIAGLNLEKEEVMAIIWLLFFDNGYTNISSECEEMCRNIKKVIYRELRNYQNARKFDEMRFFETVETLEIIERGERKFMEELMIAEMYNVRIHDDFKEIINENKY